MSSDHAHDHDHDHHDLTILYATETGTAQEVADRIARHCRHIRLRCRVFDVESYPSESIVLENLVVFVVATAGSGKEPRTMSPLWNMLLRADLTHDFFEDLHFAVFGLGDSAYDRFCWPAKKLCRRLEGLGATEICPRGEGDTQHPLGTDGALDPWIESLTDRMLQFNPLPPGVSKPPYGALHAPRVHLSPANQDDLASSTDPLSTAEGYHTFELKCNSRITASDWYQDVRHFEFRCDDLIQYVPGDVAVVHPEADPSDVEGFLKIAGWTDVADDPLRITHTLSDQSLPEFIPPTTTLRIIFTRYLDFSAVPKRPFFRILRHFASDDREREKLDEFVSPEGAEDLYDYCQRVRRTIREVLEEFRSVKVPMEYIFDVFPPLRPREFSIASSVKRHPHEVHLCVAIVDYRTKLKAPRRGVCTRYLVGLTPGVTLRIGLKKGVIVLPKDPAIPVICVGPGTGIAPMRALIQERIHAGSHENTLYFGCRAAFKDEHYASEWQAHVDEQALTYRVARSRDGPEGVRRTYVQHLLEEDAERLWTLLDSQDARVYISGSSNKMPAAVRRALARAAETAGGMNETSALAYVARMEREGRLFEECWS
ncbi:riboflavin synthase domain-like protein [Amylostereum chailletii]|nr:riboflavin synthase domain-like protein [Amylostereum chailletii]